MEESKGLEESERAVIYKNTFAQIPDTESHCTFNVGPLTLCGDVEIRFFHHALKNYTKTLTKMNKLMDCYQIKANDIPYPLVPIFRYIFHTSMIQSNKIILTAQELDAPFAGAVRTTGVIPSNISIELHFEEIKVKEKKLKIKKRQKNHPFSIRAR